LSFGRSRSNVFISGNVGYLMEKKRFVVMVLLLIFAVFLIGNFIASYKFDYPPPLVGPAITGQSLSGAISLFISGGIQEINISSPINTTYNFGIGATYAIDLNTTSNFNPDEWTYSLYDLRHNVLLNDTIAFTPNSTINATRWSNNLTVSAKETGGEWSNESVVFFVEVPNSAPLIGSLSAGAFVCENQKIGAPGAGYEFNTYDADEDNLWIQLNNSHGFFYVLSPIATIGYNNFTSRIISPTLDKDTAGGIDVGSKSYISKVTADDDYNSSCCVDSEDINITVIEMNNAPSWMGGGLGAQTIYLVGDNSDFNYQFPVTDTEDGVASSGNFSFNISFVGETLFSINESYGIVNFTPTTAHVNRTFSITVCTNDTGIANPHVNISDVCGAAEDGSPKVLCDDFTLTVSEDNRAPEISSYLPEELNFTIGGTTATTFSVVVRDPDGNIPDIDWYVNNVLKEHNEELSSDSYDYTLGCGISGEVNVTVFVGDGLLSSPVSWIIDNTEVACPVSSGVGGGGGGGGGGTIGDFCREEWVCEGWGVCQNAKRSFDARSLSLEDHFYVQEICSQNKYDERFCGFQLTTCKDLNLCNNTILREIRPSEMQVCYFTEDPSCADGITNCHGGGCELLVDCGGPCAPCATCSDGKKNQGESGIDCGGPCPYLCAEEQPLKTSMFVILSLLAVSLIAVAFIIVKGFSIVRYRFYRH
jgi:hypothetical protein